MENYVITQEKNVETTVLVSNYKGAIFAGGDYLNDYETYNLEKVNSLLKDLKESNPDNEYKIMIETDFNKMYLEEKNITPTEYLTQKINASGINIHLSKEEMKAILESGENVQKLAVKYGTNQNIESENGKNDSGAQISILNTTECSESVIGTSDWQKLEFIFDSKNRDEIEIGFRLGGNESNSKGTVWFSDFKLEKGIKSKSFSSAPS